MSECEHRYAPSLKQTHGQTDRQAEANAVRVEMESDYMSEIGASESSSRCKRERPMSRNIHYGYGAAAYLFVKWPLVWVVIGGGATAGV